MAPTPSKNGPCPCGRGKKYKKCCLERDQKNTRPDPNRYVPMAERLKHVHAMEEEMEQLNDLSNHAVDLIEARDWPAAQALCARLKQEYPDALDGDMRFEAYYSAREEYAQAREHAHAILDHIRANPESYDPEFLEDVTERLHELDRLVDAADA